MKNPKRLILMILGLVLSSQVVSPARILASDWSPSEASFITRAVYADDRLWVVSEEGSLSSIAASDKAWNREAIQGPVYDICEDQGHLIALTGGEFSSEWVLQSKQLGQWVDVATVRNQNDKVLALGCNASDIFIVTTRRLTGSMRDRLRLTVV